MRALLVDDSRATRAHLKKLLGELGWQVAEAADGRQGLDAMAAQGPFDVVLVDWNMPVMNGLEFIKGVRGELAYERTKLLMTTSESEPAQILRALQAGADEYLMKPFSREALLDKLRALQLLDHGA